MIRAEVAAPLSPGVYTVQWTAISVDGDPIQGSYSFEVNLWGWLMDQLIYGLLLITVIVIAAGTWWIFHRLNRSINGGQNKDLGENV